MPKSYTVSGLWKGKSAGGCLNHPTWRFNPQVFLTVDKKRSLKITLTQQSSHHIGFYLAIGDGSGKRQLILSKSCLVERVGFEDDPSIVAEVTLYPAQSYVLIPCTFTPRMEGAFTIQFQCSGSLKIAPLPPNKEWKSITGKGEWKGKSAGGCRNHITCINNPQFLLRTKKSALVTIVLSQTTTEGFDAMGFYMLTGKSNTYKLTRFKAEYFVAKSDFVRGPEANVTLQLEPKSKYVILPCTFSPGSESSFTITVFSDTGVKITALKDPREVHIVSEWKEGEAGGCINYSTWRTNPQFFLMVDKDTKLSVSLSQNVSPYQSIGFYVTHGNGSQVVVLSPEDVIVKSSFQKAETVSVEVLLEKSDTPYVIIPCTFRPDILLPFRITVRIASTRSRINKILQLIPCNSEWRRKSIQGYWTQNFRGGCINEKETWLNNPQFSITISETSSFAFVITQIVPDNVIGMYLIRSETGERLTDASSTTLVGASHFPKRSFEAHLQCILPAGTYIIICCTFEPEKSGDFELTVYAENDTMDMEFLPIGDNPSFVKQKETKMKNVGFVRWSDVELSDKIGQGGFGVVYRGYWNGQIVAVKRLFCDDMKDMEFESFQMEIELMSTLNHPNILSFLGAALESTSFLITEYMDRGNLSDVLTAQPKLSWKIKIQMALDAAQGIFYLHSQEPVIVHRDLKSLNLLVNNEYTVKVADFGLSKATSGKSLNSKVGSLNWCAPEILLKRMPYTPKSDVYSFGMVLYEFITHHPPFQGLNPLQIVRAIDHGELPSLPVDTLEDTVTLTEDCWKTEPEDRPDFEEIIRRLIIIQELVNENEDRALEREIEGGETENDAYK